MHRPSTLRQRANVPPNWPTRSLLAGAAILIGVALSVTACSSRKPSREWCAFFSEQGNIDCSYDTFEQCRAMVSGVGGSCTVNPALRQSEDPPKRRQR